MNKQLIEEFSSVLDMGHTPHTVFEVAGNIILRIPLPVQNSIAFVKAIGNFEFIDIAISETNLIIKYGNKK